MEGHVYFILSMACEQQQWEQPPHHGAARLPGGAATAAQRRVRVPRQPPVALARAFGAALPALRCVGFVPSVLLLASGFVIILVLETVYIERKSDVATWQAFKTLQKRCARKTASYFETQPELQKTTD